MSEVYITRTAHYLPNEPVSNDEMESYMGLIGEQASKSRRIVLRNNGIEHRYYAINKQGKGTHTNAEMVALAIRNLVEQDSEFKEIDLLSCGTSSPDQMMPSHGVMVHGWLPEFGQIEVTSPSGVCCSGMHAFKYAYMSIKMGYAKKAVCSGSERLSRALHADQFELEVQKLNDLEENGFLAFEKDFLRWMLSDGAGVFMMQPKKNPNALNLRVDWIDTYSFANVEEPCMYMAADKKEDGTLVSYHDFSPEDLIGKSVLSIKQDVKLFGKKIVSLGMPKLKESLEKRGLNIDDIDYLLPHMSSYFFKDKIYEGLQEHGMHVPYDKWFTNLKTKGNVGAGSIFLMVDELFNSGKLKKADKLLLLVPESSRFSYAFSQLTVC